MVPGNDLDSKGKALRIPAAWNYSCRALGESDTPGNAFPYQISMHVLAIDVPRKDIFVGER
jgi:hypothetical protein